MPIRLSFHGAARTVTGSSFLLDTGEARVLVDCGMFQGSKTLKELNYGPFPHDPKKLDAVLLTHAHIDHSGLLPKLMLAGFSGSILATAATCDLLAPMLPDSGHIQESEVEQLNRRNARRDKPLVSPIYTAEDAEKTLELLKPVAYATWVEAAPGLRARWWNAGHLLGSASIEVEVSRAGAAPARLLFSGDLGPDHKLLQPDPTAPTGFDYVVCESTYGATDRIDPSPAKRREALIEEYRRAHKSGGALIIPSFAVERTQELVTDLVGLMDEGAIAAAPIFVDSPLAGKATAVFRRHAGDLENGQALERAFASPHLKLVESVEDSKAIARFRGFHVIIAASGMCDAGRIRHHLKNWIARRDATVLLAGYQAQGTLGRLLQDGEPIVRIQGEEFHVRARIGSIETYSGHADGPELIAWLRERMPIAQSVFLVHGEEAAMEGLRARIATDLLPAERVVAPAMDEAFELTPAGPVRLPPVKARRIEPEAASRLDWNNDLSKLLIDIGAAVDGAADERAKRVVIRKLRRALEDGA